MDEYSGKRAVNGLVVSRKGSGLVLRETPNNRDSNAQFCNRVGCSGRLNSPKSTQTAKPRPLRPSVRPSCSGKEIVGSSSRTSASVNNPRKSSAEPCRKLSSHLESDSSETSSVRDEPEIIPPPVKIQRGVLLESRNAELEAGNSSVASNTRSRRNSQQRSVLSNQAISVGPSSSSGSKSTTMKATASSTKYGLRNIRCNSISDIVPSNCSSSDLSLSRRKETVKKRNCEGESSSTARGKKINGSSSGQNPSSNGVSISDSRRGKNMPPNRDNGVALVRTHRQVNNQTRARISNQGSGHNSSVVISERSRPEISVDRSHGSSHRLPTETPSVRSNPSSRPGSRSENARGTLTIEPPEGFSRSLRNRDSLRQFNMNGIAEVLLALERIENDEELTFEQLLALETNMFLNGLNFYDRHRDMRLDIDNMSYEELLALEERMGNVSTALTEEALSECVKRSVYESIPSKGVAADSNTDNDDDSKCSICQEEYVKGDEVGRLQCDHGYHALCIQQWLRLKNWCPICKTAAAPSPSSPSPSSSSSSSSP